MFFCFVVVLFYLCKVIFDIIQYGTACMCGNVCVPVICMFTLIMYIPVIIYIYIYIYIYVYM